MYKLQKVYGLQCPYKGSVAYSNCLLRAIDEAADNLTMLLHVVYGAMARSRVRQSRKERALKTTTTATGAASRPLMPPLAPSLPSPSRIEKSPVILLLVKKLHVKQTI